MPFLTFFAFILLGLSMLSLWIHRDPKIWGSFLFLSLGLGWLAGNILWPGMIFITILLVLWILYAHIPSRWIFLLIICLSTCFKLHLIPGYRPWFFTPKFAIGLENPLIGLFPLAFFVPLAQKAEDWKRVIKGVFWSCLGMLVIASLATLTGAVHWQFKLPAFVVERSLSNLFLTCIPEEGFYQGFVQKTLGDYFKNWRIGKYMAVILTSILFAVAHMYWSPNAGILAFSFLTGLLYGGVYLIAGKIESAILCHFLLNLIHMTFFSYHAM